MMMSMVWKKGSMLSSRSRREIAIVPAPVTSSMVRCEGFAGLQPQAQDFMRVRGTRNSVAAAAEWMVYREARF